MNLFKSTLSCYLLVYLTLISIKSSLGQNWGGSYHKMKERMSKFGEKVNQFVEPPPTIYQGPGGQQVPQKYNLRRQQSDYDQFQEQNNQDNLRISDQNQNDLGRLDEPEPEIDEIEKLPPLPLPPPRPLYQYSNYEQQVPENRVKSQDFYKNPRPVEIKSIPHQEMTVNANQLDELEAIIDEKQEKSINTLLEIEEKLTNIVNRLEIDINSEIGPKLSPTSGLINLVPDPVHVPVPLSEKPLHHVPLSLSGPIVVNDFEPPHEGKHIVRELTKVAPNMKSGSGPGPGVGKKSSFECDFKGRWLSSVLGAAFELESNSNEHLVQVKVIDYQQPGEKMSGKNEDLFKKSMINKNWFGFGVISIYKNPPTISITLQPKLPAEGDKASSATFVGQCIQCSSTKSGGEDYQDVEQVSVIRGVWILFPTKANCDSKIGSENTIRQKDILIKNNNNNNDEELNFFKNII